MVISQASTYECFFKFRLIFYRLYLVLVSSSLHQLMVQLLFLPLFWFSFVCHIYESKLDLRLFPYTRFKPPSLSLSVASITFRFQSHRLQDKRSLGRDHSYTVITTDVSSLRIQRSGAVHPQPPGSSSSSSSPPRIPCPPNSSSGEGNDLRVEWAKTFNSILSAAFTNSLRSRLGATHDSTGMHLVYICCHCSHQPTNPETPPIEVIHKARRYLLSENASTRCPVAIPFTQFKHLSSPLLPGPFWSDLNFKTPGLRDPERDLEWICGGRFWGHWKWGDVRWH